MVIFHVVPPRYHPGTTFGTTGGTRVVPRTCFDPLLTPYFDPKIRGQNQGSALEKIEKWSFFHVVPPRYHRWYQKWYQGGTRVVPRTCFDPLLTPYLTPYFDPKIRGQNQWSTLEKIEKWSFLHVVPPWYHRWYQKWYQGGTRVVPRTCLTPY